MSPIVNRQSSSLNRPKRSPKNNNEGSSLFKESSHSSKSVPNTSRRYTHHSVSPIPVGKRYNQTRHPSRADRSSSQKSRSKSQSRLSQRSLSQSSSRSNSLEPFRTRNSNHKSSNNRSPRRRDHRSKERSSSLNVSSHSIKKSHSDPDLRITQKSSDRKPKDSSTTNTYFLDLSEKSPTERRKNYGTRDRSQSHSSTADLYSNGSFSTFQTNDDDIRSGHEMSGSNSHKDKPSDKVISSSSRRRQTRSSSPQKLIEPTSSQRRKQKSKTVPSGSQPGSKDRRRRERQNASQSHSPVGRNNNNHNKKKKHELERSKSDSSLDVSKHMEDEPVEFNDDTDIGTKKKRRGKRSKNHRSSDPESMETELAQMLGSMNGGLDSLCGEGPLKDQHDVATVDMTVNSKASTKSGKSRKKRRSSKSEELKSDKSGRTVSDGESGDLDEGDLEDDEEVSPLPSGSFKTTPKPSKSTRSSASKSSVKVRKKGKKSSKSKEATPPSPGVSMAESELSKKKPKQKRRNSKTPELDVPPPPPSSVTPSSHKSKKKKRSSKSPTPAKALAPNQNKSLPKVSNHSPKLDASGRNRTPRSKKALVTSDPTGGSANKDHNANGINETDHAKNSKSSPGTLRPVKSINQEKTAIKPMGNSSSKRASPGTLRRVQSLNPETKPTMIPTAHSPGTLRRSASDMDAQKGSGGNNRLRKARSLFGAVLNPNAKGAETVGDGENSENEYEMKPNKETKKSGLLGWAKAKYSPGNYRKRLTKGFRVSGGGSGGDDRQGLLSNADHHGGPMSLLDLRAQDPDSERGGRGSLLDKEFVGEDNSIEESNSFKIPKSSINTRNNYNFNNSPNLNNSADLNSPINHTPQSQSQRRARPRGSITSDIDSDKPPFSQIISTAQITTDDDDLSDIGDPEADIQPAMEPEIMNGVEIIYDPERNDIVYDDRGHPGTIRMVHVMREILVEHQDDIEFSPEVYKVIKRRLKGRKFLLRAKQSKRTAWREASKAENVQMLADFFHEEMRQLFGGITVSKNGYDEEIEQSVPGSPRRAIDVAKDNRRDSGNNSNGYASHGSIGANKYMQRAIAECKWAQEIAKPQGDIETMNIGIDAEEKLIALIEIADQGSMALAPLREELDKLGELAKQMMYVSIAPLLERLEEIEENMADYFEQEEILLAEREDDIEDDERSGRSPSLRDRSMEKDGEMYEVRMKSESYEEEDLNLFDNEERLENEEDEDDYHEAEEEEDDHGHEEEGRYDDESDEESGTNVKEGEVLKCDHTDPGEVSSVGESGIYDESDSDDDDSDLEDGEKADWVDFGEEDDDEDDDYDSDTHEELNSSDEESELSDEPKRKKTIFDEPNPKLKQFFDRLNHFFETRRRIEERAAKTDPSNKCRKIKVKAHSGGIVKKSGEYKKEFQQRDTNDRIVRNLDDLYTAAKTAYPDFKSIVQQIGDDISGLDFKMNVILPPMKSREKAYEKAKTEYGSRDLGPPESWLYDICRAGIICSNIKQLGEVSKWLIRNTHVVQAKNRFLDPVFNGYRDLLYHVSIPYQDGNAHICEIQVHLKEIYVMNDQCGTIKHYEFFRSGFSNPFRSQEDTLLDLKKMNKYTKIEGPFMKKLLKSEDTEQLLLFAGIFRNKIEEYDRSLELYRRVLGLQEDAHGSDNEEMADTYLSIGLVLGAMGDTEESLQNLLKALAIKESFLGADHIEVADAYVEIGHMLSKRGDYSGAYTQYLRTQVIRESKLGKEHFLVIKSLQDIGLVLQKKGDFQESETEYRKALTIQKDVLGEGHSDLALTHSFIGKTLCLYGDFEKAMLEETMALAIREKVFGKNHRLTAESHTAIGVLLFHKGDYKTSRWHHSRALKIRESMLGKDDEECAISHRYLGEVLSSCEGDYEGAVKELKRAQEILEANVGRDHQVTAESYAGLGHIHCQHGKHEEALAEYRRAKVILESNLGQTHPETAATYMYTGNALNLAGDHDGALQMHRKALVVFESVLGNAHPRTADGYRATAEVYEASGHPEMALSEYREALKLKRDALRKDYPSIAEIAARIGKLLLNCCDSSGNTGLRDPRGALEIYRETLEITEERCGKDHPATAIARFDVSVAMTALAKEQDGDAQPRLLDEAEEKLRASLGTLRELEPIGDTKPTKSYFLGFGEKAAITGRACVALGKILVKKGKDEEAKDMFVEGLERLIKVLGGDHPDTMEAESKLLSFVAES